MRCQLHLARRQRPPSSANAPNMRFSATKARANGANAGTTISKALSYGEVERRAVFPAANGGTLSRTSTYQWASLGLTARSLQRLLGGTDISHGKKQSIGCRQPDRGPWTVKRLLTAQKAVTRPAGTMCRKGGPLRCLGSVSTFTGQICRPEARLKQREGVPCRR